MLPSGLQCPGSREPFTYSKALVVEGMSAFQFHKALLRDLGLLNEVEIRNYGAITDLGDYLDVLRMIDGFNNVDSLGVVQDAENRSVDQAFQSVRNKLRVSGFEAPDQPMTKGSGRPGVSVFILPNCLDTGMLETLCLQTVASDPAIQCVSEYFQCLQTQGINLPRNMSKAQAQAFLASRPEFVAHVGEAAHKGYWPWNSPVLDQLKQFLQNL
jgi:hypothetical protein